MNWPANRRMQLPLLASAALLAATFALPVASQAAGGYLATSNGIAGVTQTLVIALPGSANSTVKLTASTAGTSAPLSAVLNSQGLGSVTWTPNTSGVWTISAGAVQPTTQITVIAAPTLTSIHAPGQLQYAVAADSTLAYVRSLAGNSAPQGTVTLHNRQGKVLGTGLLQTASEPATSVASISWTPDQAGAYPLIGTYTPANGATANSTSSLVQPEIVGGVPMVSYRFAPALRLGVTSQISAVLGAGLSPGSVGFIFDGVAPRGSVPTQAGVATTSWSPPNEGLHLLRAEFTGNNPGFSGVALQQIKALPAAVPDAVSVVLGAIPLQPGGTAALAIGTSQELSGSSASGSPIAFGASGSCVLAASRLVALSRGMCTLTAKSFGSDSFLSTTMTYAIVTSPVTVAG